MTQTTLLKYFGRKIPPPNPIANGTIQQSQDIKDAIEKSLPPVSLENIQNTEPLPSTTRLTDQISTTHSQIPAAISRQSRVCIVPVQTDHIPTLKALTAVTLPVRYPDKFFNGAIEDSLSAQVSKVVLYDLQPVGWIRCRIETTSPTSAGGVNVVISPKQLYVQALCILAPYRGLGLATDLLTSILNQPGFEEFGVSSIYAHVWEHNEAALEWYEKRNFKRVMLISGYYRRLKPSNAWIVRREV